MSESARSLFGSSSAADSFEAFMKAKAEAEREYEAGKGGRGFSGFYSSYGKGGHSSYGKDRGGKGGEKGGPTVHSGVSCDGCGMNPVIGTRHKKRGENYDLCQSCVDQVPPACSGCMLLRR